MFPSTCASTQHSEPVEQATVEFLLPVPVVQYLLKYLYTPSEGTLASLPGLLPVIGILY